MNHLQIICIALLGLLVFVLGANVTRHRAIRGDTGNQQPTDPADRMYIAQRAHGNATEYVPTLIVLIVVCAALSDSWWVDVLAVAAVVVSLPARRRPADRQDPGLARPGPGRGRDGHLPQRHRPGDHGRRLDVNAARPVVGIAGAGYVVPRFWGELEVRGVPTSYVDAIAAAGGRPIILPPGQALDALDLVDAVVLAGGDDVGVDPERDRDETALLRAARVRETPLLAVCRGLQVLAVADGGSLIPDLGTDLPHVRPEVGHPVDDRAGVGGGVPARREPHRELAPPPGRATLGCGWRPTARTADGLIEAAEWTGAWPAVGVQWHPELDSDRPGAVRVAGGGL